MAGQRPGRGKPFPPGNHTFGGHTIALGADGAIKVRAGDTISRFAGCLYKDVLVGWEEFGRKAGPAVERLADPNRVQVGETIYHIPTWKGQKPAIPAGPAVLLFDGATLTWEAADGSTVVEVPAVSGLRANNPSIDKLIKAGRTDVKKGVDYTDPKYQDVPMVGPIPEGEYYLALRPGMPFEKTGGGWGVGAWPLTPTGRVGKIAHWLDVKFDLPGVRSGFFLHEDGTRLKSGESDGTAGCIGVLKGQDVLDLQKRLSDYHTNGKHSRIIVRVKY